MPQLLNQQPVRRFCHPAARQRLGRQDQAAGVSTFAADESGLAKREDILGDLEAHAIAAPVAMVDLDDADDDALKPAPRV